MCGQTGTSVCPAGSSFETALCERLAALRALRPGLQFHLVILEAGANGASRNRPMHRAAQRAVRLTPGGVGKQGLNLVQTLCTRVLLQRGSYNPTSAKRTLISSCRDHSLGWQLWVCAELDKGQGCEGSIPQTWTLEGSQGSFPAPHHSYMGSKQSPDCPRDEASQKARP